MNPKSPEAMDERPFEGMRIDDSSILDRLNGRSACPKCSKSRKYFCYTCYVPISELANAIPNIKLPIKIDIIKHKSEIDGKSTAVHGAILAPDHITVYTYPHIPDYSHEENVYLVYPSMKAVDVASLFDDDARNNLDDIKAAQISEDNHRQRTLLTKRAECPVSGKKTSPVLLSPDGLPIKRAVFIDSTWNQSRGIYKDERMRRLPCVVIQDRISQFWRHQKGSPRWYLATVEAVHQFLLEVHLNAWGVSPNYRGPHCEGYRSEPEDGFGDVAYNGQYDNILFFFSHMYKKIHSYYDHDQLKAYQRPMS